MNRLRTKHQKQKHNQVKYCDGTYVHACVRDKHIRNVNHHKSTHIQYALHSGGFYSGSVPQPVKYKNATLYFRGRYIHAALINSLMDAYV